uniref:Uncharacterized protein n=1 Tax=Parascaris univalens TaxID=6257 RepID=A0A915B4V9_PARUN
MEGLLVNSLSIVVPLMLVFQCLSKTRKKDPKMPMAVDKSSSTIQEIKEQKQLSNKQSVEERIKSPHKSAHDNSRKSETKQSAIKVKEINVAEKQQKNPLNIKITKSLENPRKRSMEIEKTQTTTEVEQTQSTMPSFTGKISNRETNDKKCSLKEIVSAPISKTATEVAQQSIFKNLSGHDDLPLPEAEFDDTTQPSNSIKMNDEDDTDENVGELREDNEQSEDQ